MKLVNAPNSEANFQQHSKNREKHKCLGNYLVICEQFSLLTLVLQFDINFLILLFALLDYLGCNLELGVRQHIQN